MNLSPVISNNIVVLPHIVKLTCVMKSFIHKKLKTKYSSKLVANFFLKWKT